MINKSYLKFIFKILLTLVILWSCFNFVDSIQLLNVLSSISLSPMFFSFFLNTIGSIIIPAILTQHALQIERIRLTIRELIAINFVMRFYSLILPRGASIGFRWYRYKKGGSGNDAMALMVFERVAQLLIITFAATLFLGAEQNMLDIEGEIIWGITLLIFLLCFFIFCIFVFPPLSNIFHNMLNKYEKWMPDYINKKLLNLWNAIYAFNNLTKSKVIIVLLFSSLSYILLTASPYIIALMLDMNISLIALAWIRSLVFLLTLIPITVGGIGIREGSFVFLLQLYDVPPHEALVFSFLVLSIQLMIGLIGAILETWENLIKHITVK